MDYQITTREYWKNRDIIGYLNSIEHPHRKFIIKELRKLFPFESLLEIGCGPGTNLVNIHKKFSEVALTGIDVNKLAIFKARELLPDSNLIINDLSSLPFNKNSFDIVLSDAVLIYIDPFNIRILLEDMLRISKKALILIELNGNTKLGELKDNLWYRDYKKLLKRKGLKIIRYKITEDIWPSPPWIENGYIYIVHHLSQTLKTS